MGSAEVKLCHQYGHVAISTSSWILSGDTSRLRDRYRGPPAAGDRETDLDLERDREGLRET